MVRKDDLKWWSRRERKNSLPHVDQPDNLDRQKKREKRKRKRREVSWRREKDTKKPPTLDLLILSLSLSLSLPPLFLFSSSLLLSFQLPSQWLPMTTWLTWLNSWLTYLPILFAFFFLPFALFFLLFHSPIFPLQPPQFSYFPTLSFLADMGFDPGPIL